MRLRIAFFEFPRSFSCVGRHPWGNRPLLASARARWHQSMMQRCAPTLVRRWVYGLQRGPQSLAGPKIWPLFPLWRLTRGCVAVAACWAGVLPVSTSAGGTGSNLGFRGRPAGTAGPGRRGSDTGSGLVQHCGHDGSPPWSSLVMVSAVWTTSRATVAVYCVVAGRSLRTSFGGTPLSAPEFLAGPATLSLPGPPVPFAGQPAGRSTRAMPGLLPGTVRGWQRRRMTTGSAAPRASCCPPGVAASCRGRRHPGCWHWLVEPWLPVLAP